MSIRNAIDSSVYEIIADFSNSIDLTENSKYGKVNNNGEYVIPDYEKMLFFKNKRFKVFNFVHDAFFKFQEDMNFRPIEGKGAVGSRLFTSDATLAAPDARKVYENYLNTAHKSYARGLFGTEDERKIVRVENLIDHYIETLRHDDRNLPITLTKFIKSNLSFVNPCISGLMIELLSDQKSLFIKNANFIKEVWFSNYVNSAAKAGFLVDRRVPWRLVANLNSENLHVYMNKYNITKDNFFDSFYIKTASLDIQYLKDFFLFSYKSLIGQTDLAEASNLYFTYPARIEECDKTISRVIKRETIDEESYYKILFDDFFWIRKYIDIRILEEEISLNKSLREKLIFDIYSIYNQASGGNPLVEASRYVNLFLEQQK